MAWLWKRNPAQTDYEKPAKGIKGITIRYEPDRERFRTAFDMTTRRELEAHAEYNRVYEGSIAGSIIDTETDDIFAQGWALLSEDTEAVGKVREYLDKAGFEQELRKMVTESKIYGFGIAEVGTVGTRHVLVAHSSLNITPVMDGSGWLDGWRQTVEGKTATEWTAKEVVSIALRPNANTPGTGYSELMHAYAAIIDYENIRQANAEMIMRAGYPTYNIEFDGDGVSPSGLIDGEIADLGPGSAVMTALGAKIQTLNAAGITQVQAYAEMALQAVAASMQVPRAMVGLSDNSEATAKVNLAKYYNRVQAEQGIIASTIQARYLDLYVLPDLGIKPGSVTLVFNNPDPDAQLARVALIKELATIDPADPEFLVSVEEMAEIYGKHPRPGEYDGAEAQAVLQEKLTQHLRDALGVGGKEPEA